MKIADKRSMELHRGSMEFHRGSIEFHGVT